MDQEGNLVLPCIVCGEVLDPVFKGRGEDNQPSGGLAFVAHGAYGSNVFDPTDSVFLEVNICDPCLEESGAAGRVYLGRRLRPVVMEVVYSDNETREAVVGHERVDRPYVKWSCDHYTHYEERVVDSREELLLLAESDKFVFGPLDGFFED